MEPQEAIQALGLSEKEARVYLTLLEGGVMSAYLVAKKSGLKRPTAYVILDELSNKGVVFEAPRSHTKLFRAFPPERFVEKMEKKLEQVKALLPELKAREQVGVEKPHAMFFEGVEGMKEILHYKLKELVGGNFTSFMATAREDVIKLFDRFEVYNDRLRSLNITIRGISPADPKLKSYRDTDSQYGRSVIEVPADEYNSKTAFEVGPTWIKIYDLDNLQGLIIENPSAAQGLRQIFEMLWKRLGTRDSRRNETPLIK
jgi:sugar-specific transcriptional regulator TrmB